MTETSISTPAVTYCHIATSSFPGKGDDGCFLKRPWLRLTPIEIVTRAIWLYFLFNVSLREVEGLMLEPGVVVSYETVGWCRKRRNRYHALFCRRAFQKPIENFQKCVGDRLGQVRCRLSKLLIGAVDRVLISPQICLSRVISVDTSPPNSYHDAGHIDMGARRRFYHQMVLFKASGQGYGIMRSTINLDDTLMERARSLTGTKETAALVRQALETLVRVESGKRLIALGGTMPDAEAAPRRRSAAAK